MLPPYPQYGFFRFIRRHISGTGSGPIVDAPCGEGQIANWVASAFPSRKVLGVDIDQQCIEHAHSTFPRDNLTFQEADIHSFLDTAGPIDQFLLVNSIFLLPEPQRVITAIYGKLLAGGSLAVIIPNEESTNFKNFQELNPRTNTLVLGKKDAAKFFSEAGFQVEVVKGVCYTTIYGNRLLPRLGRLKGVYIYAGDFINRLFGKKASYWGFLLKKAKG